METLDSISKRCSLKGHLSDRPIEAEKIRKIMEAALLAPSARNMQPWRFIVVQGKEAVEAITEGFFEFNQMVRTVPVILVACARAADDVEHDGKEYYLFDVGMAVENMLLAATDLGLVTHLMTALDEVKMKEILHIPDDVRVVVATPLAYPLEATYDAASEERLSQRTRKPYEDVVYTNKWDEKEPT